MLAMRLLLMQMLALSHPLLLRTKTFVVQRILARWLRLLRLRKRWMQRDAYGVWAQLMLAQRVLFAAFPAARFGKRAPARFGLVQMFLRLRSS
jgi:hypothetical protein